MLLKSILESLLVVDLRKLARGQECMVRVPLHCNGDNATTCLAHYRLAGYSGTGMKSDDFAMGAWCCSECHRVVDNLVKTEHDRSIVRLMHAEGCLRTMAELRQMKARGELP